MKQGMSIFRLQEPSSEAVQSIFKNTFLTDKSSKAVARAIAFRDLKHLLDLTDDDLISLFEDDTDMLRLFAGEVKNTSSSFMLAVIKRILTLDHYIMLLSGGGVI